jgi:hypothetical protein
MTFGLPIGSTGKDGNDGISSTITLGTITTETLSSSSSALVNVTNSGTINDAIFNFKFQIPQGIQGIQGIQGNQGDKGEKGDNEIDANYVTVAAMIAANDAIITTAYIFLYNFIYNSSNNTITNRNNNITNTNNSINRLEK